MEVKSVRVEASVGLQAGDLVAVCLQLRRGATGGARGSVAALPFTGAAPCAVGVMVLRSLERKSF